MVTIDRGVGGASGETLHLHLLDRSIPGSSMGGSNTVDGPLTLSQMGSGENWVGYHVAVHLSLHRLFRGARAAYIDRTTYR